MLCLQDYDSIEDWDSWDACLQSLTPCAARDHAVGVIGDVNMRPSSPNAVPVKTLLLHWSSKQRFAQMTAKCQRPMLTDITSEAQSESFHSHRVLGDATPSRSLIRTPCTQALGIDASGRGMLFPMDDSQAPGSPGDWPCLEAASAVLGLIKNNAATRGTACNGGITTLGGNLKFK